MSEHDNSGSLHGLAERLGEDFPLRLGSGLAMGVVATLFTVWGLWPFAILVVLVALVVSWEWGRLVHGREADIVVAVNAGAATVAAVLAAMGFALLGLMALMIGAILATLLSLGRHSAFAALGVLYAGLPAVALIWLRSDAALGLRAVIFLVVVVVTADTAGFLAGRLLGGPKLWPRVSPNKTWAGLLGALIASAVVASLFRFAVPDSSAAYLAVTGAVLALVAQLGDLGESALKRRFGAKDTGAILPGHGGVMDRVDGLVAAASVVGIAAFAIDVHSPARALLLGA